MSLMPEMTKEEREQADRMGLTGVIKALDRLGGTFHGTVKMEAAILALYDAVLELTKSVLEQARRTNRHEREHAEAKRSEHLRRLVFKD